MKYTNIVISMLLFGLTILPSCIGKGNETVKEDDTGTVKEQGTASHETQAEGVSAGTTEEEQLRKLYDRLYPELRNGLVIVKTETFGDDYYEGDWVSCDGLSFTVKNKSIYDIPGNVYSILFKEGYWGGGEMAQEIIPGADIKRGETVTLKTKKLASSTESENSQIIKIKELSFEEFKSLFHLTKEEREAAIKSLPEKVKIHEPLAFSVEGLMGGCATRLSLDGTHGYLHYNSNGKSYEFNQQRDVIFESYAIETQKLVLRVENSGTRTGQLSGTLKNGKYTGQFINVNGKTSPFTFE